MYKKFEYDVRKDEKHLLSLLVSLNGRTDDKKEDLP